MRVRQRPVTALRAERYLTVASADGDVQVAPGDWIVIDAAGMMRRYRHAHFVTTFEPDDEEAETYWATLPASLLSQDPG